MKCHQKVSLTPVTVPSKKPCLTSCPWKGQGYLTWYVSRRRKSLLHGLQPSNKCHFFDNQHLRGKTEETRAWSGFPCQHWHRLRTVWRFPLGGLRLRCQVPITFRRPCTRDKCRQMWQGTRGSYSSSDKVPDLWYHALKAVWRALHGWFCCSLWIHPRALVTWSNLSWSLW